MRSCARCLKEIHAASLQHRKRGIAALIDWIDTSGSVFLVQLRLMSEQLEQLDHENAEAVDRFVAATNMRAAIQTAITERQRIDQLKAKLVQTLGLEGY